MSSWDNPGWEQKRVLFWLFFVLFSALTVWLVYKAWASQRDCDRDCRAKGFERGEWHAGTRTREPNCGCEGR